MLDLITHTPTPLVVLTAALLIMATSLSGVVFAHGLTRRFLEARLSLLVAFSAGVFLVTASVLVVEAVELLAPLLAVASIAAGYLLALFMHRLLPETHHHHDGDCHRTHRGARRLLVGDALHNVADGIMLVPAFLASPALGLAVTVSVLIHEVLQELSEFFVLRQAGYRTSRALLLNALVSSTIFVGVAVGFLADVAGFEGALLGVAAGFFLHVVVHDLWPRHAPEHGLRHRAHHLGLALVGVLAMVGVNLSTGAAHLHEGGVHSTETDDEHHDEHEHHDEEVLPVAGAR